MDLLKQMLHKRWGIIGLTLILSIFSMILSLWWNVGLSSIINAINYGLTIPVKTITISIIIIIMSSLLSHSISILTGLSSELLSHDLRMGYARHIITLPVTKTMNINSGEYLSKLQNEITDVTEYIRSNLFTIVNDLIRFSITFTWMLWLNPKLTLIINLPTILIMFYTVYSSKVIEGAVHKSQGANSDMGRLIDTLLCLFPILKLYDSSPLIIKPYDKAREEWEKYTISRERTTAKLMSLSGLLTCIPLLLLLLIGGTQVIKGEITLGTLYIYLNLSGNVSGVMINMPGRIAGLRQFIANMDRLKTSVLVVKSTK